MATKLDMQMFHDASWKPAYCEAKRPKVKVASYNSSAEVGLCTFVCECLASSCLRLR